MSDELSGFSLDGLYELLKGRKKELPEGSYTISVPKGLDKILKKVGEGPRRSSRRTRPGQARDGV